MKKNGVPKSNVIFNRNPGNSWKTKKFKEINRLRTLGASGRLRKSPKTLINSFQISIWANLGASKPLKSFKILAHGVWAPKTWKFMKNHRKMDKYRFTRTETVVKWCRILFFCILDWFGVVYCTFLHPPCIFHNFFIEIGRKSRVGRLWCDLSGTL